MDEILVSNVERKAEVNAMVFLDTDRFKALFDIGKMFASSSLVPQQYQGKPMDCAIAVEMASRIGVSPMMVMQNLYVVKGKPSWSGQACMAMIRGTGDFREITPIYIGEQGKDNWGCFIRAKKASDGSIVNGPKVTIDMAKQEGWYSKKDKFGNETSKWQTMPELMLAYRAAAFFARIYVPNILMGCQVEGEAEDMSNATIVKRAEDPFKTEINTENQQVSIVEEDGKNVFNK